jgi:hypothetical protein
MTRTLDANTGRRTDPSTWLLPMNKSRVGTSARPLFGAPLRGGFIGRDSVVAGAGPRGWLTIATPFTGAAPRAIDPVYGAPNARHIDGTGRAPLAEAAEQRARLGLHRQKAETSAETSARAWWMRSLSPWALRFAELPRVAWWFASVQRWISAWIAP